MTVLEAVRAGAVMTSSDDEYLQWRLNGGVTQGRFAGDAWQPEHSTWYEPEIFFNNDDGNWDEWTIDWTEVFNRSVDEAISE